MRPLRRFRDWINLKLVRRKKTRWIQKQIQAIGGNDARGSARRLRQLHIRRLKDAIIIDLMTRHRIGEIKRLTRDEWERMEYRRQTLSLAELARIKKRCEE